MPEFPPSSYPLGAHPLADGRCCFKVWAPKPLFVKLEILGRAPGEPSRIFELQRQGDVHGLVVDDVHDGDRYYFVLESGERRPDPRSRRQPEGVHGPSAVVDFGKLGLHDQRRNFGKPADWTIYELHVGTFTKEGTFDALARRLPYLRDELGVDAIELMPVASFPGTRNWGYDGVHLYAVQESYGGPAGLARLVKAAHEVGLAVILDVVYNHLGPEGNYLREYGPYFTKKHQTPWGEGINFDDDGAPFVRSWALDNALQWVRDYRIDALRLDAVHAIQDDSSPHILAAIAAAVQAVGGALIAESELNDPITVRGRPDGWGCDAQWSDDLHHALHAILTGERTGYYQDYGTAEEVAVALRQGFVYDGSRYSAFRKKQYGKSPMGMAAERHVVCIQNHDQVGNRARGDRIAQLAGIEAAKLAAAVVLLSPQVPMLFMGEEWAASTPFPYFTSHGDEKLARAVTEGRRNEFKAFAWQGEVPDPQDERTFESAILDPAERTRPPHAGIFAWYRRLLELRRGDSALQGTDRQTRSSAQALSPGSLLLERRAPEGHAIVLLVSFDENEHLIDAPPGRYELLLDSGDPAFAGSGAKAPRTIEGRLKLPPKSAWIYRRA